MPILLPVLAIGALLFFLARKAAPGGIPKVWIPVRFASGETDPSVKAQWHATDEQTKLFGPRYPEYWSRNGYFAFGKDFYKPDWHVPLEGGH